MFDDVRMSYLFGSLFFDLGTQLVQNDLVLGLWKFLGLRDDGDEGFVNLVLLQFVAVAAEVFHQLLQSLVVVREAGQAESLKKREMNNF